MMPTPEQKRELTSKITALVLERFGGDYGAAFTYYDVHHSGLLAFNDLIRVLQDAGVGSHFTRAMWVDGVIAYLDADGDGLVSRKEFMSVVK